MTNPLSPSPAWLGLFLALHLTPLHSREEPLPTSPLPPQEATPPTQALEEDEDEQNSEQLKLLAAAAGGALLAGLLVFFSRGRSIKEGHRAAQELTQAEEEIKQLRQALDACAQENQNLQGQQDALRSGERERIAQLEAQVIALEEKKGTLQESLQALEEANDKLVKQLRLTQKPPPSLINTAIRSIYRRLIKSSMGPSQRSASFSTRHRSPSLSPRGAKPWGQAQKKAF